MSDRAIRVLILLILCLVIPKISAAGRPITWSPTSLERHLTSSLSFAETIIFSSSASFDRLDVSIVPALQRFVTVSPATFVKVAPNVNYSVTLTFSVPAAVTLASVNGVIVLRSGFRAVPGTLKLDLKFGTAAVQPPTPDSIIQTPAGERYPVNQLFVRLKNSFTLNDATHIANEVDGTVTREVYLHSIPADARAAVQKVEDLLIRPKLTQVEEDRKLGSLLIQ